MFKKIEIDTDFKIVQSEKSSAPALSPEAQERIESIWKIEKEKRPEIFNGSLFALDSVDGSSYYAKKIEYKQSLAQYREPELYSTLKIETLSVTGVLFIEDHYVFGKRARNLTHNPGFWELVPSGTLSTTDYKRQILDELWEEVGLRDSHLMSIRPLFFLKDCSTHLMDLVIEMKASVSLNEARKLMEARTTREYESFEFIPASSVTNFLKSKNSEICEASHQLLNFYLEGGE